MKDNYLDKIIDNTLENLFGNLEPDKLVAIKEKLSIKAIKRGDILFHQNDQADGIYILLSGKLEVIALQNDGKTKRVGFVNRAETVGEMALLSDDLRSATVVCFRNSLLARMSNQTFIELCYSNAEFALKISRFIVNRLKESIHTKRSKIKITNIALHDAGLTPITDTVIQDILENFRPLPNVSVVDRYIAEELVFEINPNRGEDNQYLELDHYINDLELKEQRLFFDLRGMDNAMISHLIDYSDLAIEFCDAALCQKEESSSKSFLQNLSNIQSKINYIFCHSSDTVHPVNTHKVLEKLHPGPHTHVKEGSEKDVKRIVRYINGQSIGLVLGGGGAKGIAHLGILQALQDSGIEIDYIAGTSMGAIYAAIYAMQQDSKKVFDISSKSFSTNPTAPLDLNFFPRYSIYNDKKINRILLDIYGNTRVEDLWLPFYCISSNLTKPEMTVHEQGLLRDVVRTSMAVPGLFKPIMINNNVHVDGGVFNNIPIDVMMQKNIGYIMASRVDKEEIQTNDKIPNFLHTLMKSTIANSDHHSNRLQPFVDLYFQPKVSKYGLLKWKAHDQIFEDGYQHAREVLHDNPDLVQTLKALG